jgi:hypothetical protein
MRASPKTQLRVLLVEDSEDDALLILRELKKAGFVPESSRVETAEEHDTVLGGVGMYRSGGPDMG